MGRYPQMGGKGRKRTNQEERIAKRLVKIPESYRNRFWGFS